jgi:Pin2-interacting protein X1
VHHKLDVLGIGAQHTQDPNGVAWKQSKDFEDLLRRLNAGSEGKEEGEGGEDVVVDGFKRATGDVDDGPKAEDLDKKSKKRKRDRVGDGETRKKKKDKKGKVAAVDDDDDDEKTCTVDHPLPPS